MSRAIGTSAPQAGQAATVTSIVTPQVLHVSTFERPPPPAGAPAGARPFYSDVPPRLNTPAPVRPRALGGVAWHPGAAGITDPRVLAGSGTGR
ncbi:hypothetical protein AMYX_26600 [Anaeromyxobacter diazotrophicus]|uniref:Uncharacterized protein n=1 Tax=Anaeromyxobacter diazotrophicus TaxID=2590199 RepID=A0A7I9VP72_9BACT|nr:hypothetical protein AMYX_26600 [Anaeromyxobacter diazotrophicus]